VLTGRNGGLNYLTEQQPTEHRLNDSYYAYDDDKVLAGMRTRNLRQPQELRNP
jgi:hypothetical protein